jgi:hypothetical protein
MLGLSFMHRVADRPSILAMLAATPYFRGLRLQYRFCGVIDAVWAMGQNVGSGSNFARRSVFYGPVL